jgi:hypothetical protein
MLMTFISGAYISGAHSVINRAWALHHKLGQSELLTGPQLRHPDDSVEERMHGHKGTKSSTRTYTCSTRLERIQFEDQKTLVFMLLASHLQ